MRNLALDTTHQDLVAEYSAKLEHLISQEIVDALKAWVLERPNLGAWPAWRGAGEVS